MYHVHFYVSHFVFMVKCEDRVQISNVKVFVLFLWFPPLSFGIFPFLLFPCYFTFIPHTVCHVLVENNRLRH